ncbi:MAG: LSU ribosomal protein L18p (L5e) [uncultured Aureispira sp.]|uniref:Large ribosomal subunit protein uL18 n=1 Tax=uncultured Aureispira sp. TaxID=1331704 RepID=A0A6S6TKF3_9BACT|nr:MAG: LSU ribosomal protein L18p (L5e) [uncultured Aureispira sp.]
MSSKTLSSRKRVHRRIRKKISGTATRPRLSVYRSNKSIYAQLINDETATTLVAACLKEVEVSGSKIDQARAVGRALATKAMEAGITTVVFDRSGYIYHGRVKALAEGARGERKEDGTNELLQF